tara:strand:+ start:5368 stop:6129 length:762 start_codon:yes stop_codon:yes gene_type:complete
MPDFGLFDPFERQAIFDYDWNDFNIQLRSGISSPAVEKMPKIFGIFDLNTGVINFKIIINMKQIKDHFSIGLFTKILNIKSILKVLLQYIATDAIRTLRNGPVRTTGRRTFKEDRRIQEGTTMRVQLAILATAMLTLMMTGAMSAHAARSPTLSPTLTDFVGNWGTSRGCVGAGDFGYVRNGANVQRIVRDGPREYQTPVQVKFENGFVRVRMDEKVYTFRLSGPNRLQALKYTDSRTGLSAKISPRTWFRCS